MLDVGEDGRIKQPRFFPESIPGDGHKWWEHARAEDLIGEALRRMPHTCSLDVAEEGELSMMEVAEIMGMPRQSAEWFEKRAYERLRAMGNSGKSDDPMENALRTPKERRFQIRISHKKPIRSKGPQNGKRGQPVKPLKPR